MQPDRTLSHYRLTEKIGEGGMGVVWKAKDTVLGRTVAVKVLPADVSRDEARRAMFLQEARLASQVSNAHIVQVHEFGREGDLDFIVMEYVEGKPLSQVLHGRPLPSDKVAAIGLQVAKALSSAHRKGLLHRDLKPSNILITPDGEAKVVDFGLATLFERQGVTSGPDATTRSTVDAFHGASSTGSVHDRRPVMGTIHYMSPEQARGEDLDARSDIFSLGIVLYEMTTGRRPFAGATGADVIQEVVKADPRAVHDLMPKVPLDLDRIVQKALAKRRSDRYQTMDDLAVDLKRLERELDSGSAPSYEDLRAKLPERPRWFVWACGVAMVGLAVGAGAWWLASRGAAKLDPHRIVILPFEVRGQEEGADYVGRAFAEAVAIDLVQAKELQVLQVARAVGGGVSDPQSLLKEAASRNAGVLLTGRLVRDKESVQASVQLVDVGSGRIRWAAQQSSIHGDLSYLASAFARQALGSLGADSPKVYDHPMRLAGDPELTKSPIAVEVVGAVKRSDLTSAMPLAVKLVEAFPRSVEARAMQGQVLLGILDRDPTPRNRKALEDCVSALVALDPANPYSSMFRGSLISQVEGKPREATELLTSVISRTDLSPALRAWVLRMRAPRETALGDHAAALKDLQEAVDLDPTAFSSYATLSRALRLAGAPEEALVRSRQAVALNPTNWFTWAGAYYALADLGRHEESLPYASKACELSRQQGECASLAIVFVRLNRRSDAKAAAERAAGLTPSSYGAYNLACYHALVGEKREALASLRRALDLGFADVAIEKDPDFAALRGDPRFEAIVAEARKRLKEN